MKFSRWPLVMVLAISFHGLLALACGMPPPALAKRKPVIQVAILLDTSNSMDGLIDQARTQLWRVVNEFGRARKNGVMPELQVSLYEYGNDGLPAERGHIRRVLPFTTDLDKVSEELFALRTNGGNEYCGQVIAEAVRGVQWTNAPEDLRVIFIAGNEEFTQGSVDYRTAIAAAVERGILVNTIFCGERAEGLETKWGIGATMADGRYVAIDQNAQVAEIEAPQDREIALLGVKLNETYIAYGSEGSKGLARQSVQDKNLEAKMGANVQRQIAKSSANYMNASWDLVDASKEKKVDVEKLKTEDLPPEMRRMTAAERKAHIRQAEQKRTEIQKRITLLSAERQKYVDAQRVKLPPAATTLDEAIIAAVREAGKKRGFAF